MSRHGDVTFGWADGEYTFRLGIGEIRRLQERTNAGPHELLTRFLNRTWRIEDLRETVRLGLEGGRSKEGTPTDAEIRRLVADYVDGRPWLDTVLVCARILSAALSGAEDEPLPKPAAAEGAEQSLRTESSPSPQFMDGAESSDLRQPRSTGSRSGNSGLSAKASRKRTGRKRNPHRQPEMNSTVW